MSHERTGSQSSNQGQSHERNQSVSSNISNDQYMSEYSDSAWIGMQRRTFQRWVNNHLIQKKFAPIEDLDADWDNGIKLMELIYCITDYPIPKHNKQPKLRAHKIDNLAIAFKMLDDVKIKTIFLKSTHLLDKDSKMILGMIWSIILHYNIKGISVGELTAKEALLSWCKKKTTGYRDVDIVDFTREWSDGMAFCAIIHSHIPYMIDYNALQKSNAKANLEFAFTCANKLSIPRLLDVEDVASTKVDERSIMTYVSEMYHYFELKFPEEEKARRAAEEENKRRQQEEEEAKRRAFEEIENQKRRALEEKLRFKNSLWAMRKEEAQFQLERSSVENAKTMNDFFSLDYCDPDLQLYHGRLGVTKKLGTGDRHVSVSTGVKYTSGIHYMEFRPVRSSKGLCAIGIQEEDKTLSPYPGHQELKTGKSLFGLDGSLLTDGIQLTTLNDPEGSTATESANGINGILVGMLPLPFFANDYVGVLLNMNNKTVTFSVNGIMGPTQTLTGDGYYFIVNLCDPGDSVEIVSNYCYHR